MDNASLINEGRTALGIEFGSTRIKGVLIDYDGNILATGSHEWENRFENGVWTYRLPDAEDGMRSCYKEIKEAVKANYGVTLRTTGAIRPPMLPTMEKIPLAFATASLSTETLI